MSELALPLRLEPGDFGTTNIVDDNGRVLFITADSLKDSEYMTKKRLDEAAYIVGLCNVAGGFK